MWSTTPPRCRRDVPGEVEDAARRPARSIGRRHVVVVRGWAACALPAGSAQARHQTRRVAPMRRMSAPVTASSRPARSSTSGRVVALATPCSVCTITESWSATRQRRRARRQDVRADRRVDRRGDVGVRRDRGVDRRRQVEREVEVDVEVEQRRRRRRAGRRRLGRSSPRRRPARVSSISPWLIAESCVGRRVRLAGQRLLEQRVLVGACASDVASGDSALALDRGVDRDRRVGVQPPPRR